MSTGSSFRWKRRSRRAFSGSLGRMSLRGPMTSRSTVLLGGAGGGAGGGKVGVEKATEGMSVGGEEWRENGRGEVNGGNPV